MGWWWTSRGGENEITANDSAIIQEENELPSPNGTSANEGSKSSLLSREEQSNQELVAWLREIQAEAELRQQSATKDSSPQSSFGLASDDISPDSLYPTEISCRSAFDYAMFCQSFGGQFVNIYRYGSFRSCSNHWQDFWLCMRTRNWEEKERQKAIQEHYRKKAIKYKTGPSSEDVWQMRTEPVRDPFRGNLEELEQQIEEWKRTNPNVEEPLQKTQ